MITFKHYLTEVWRNACSKKGSASWTDVVHLDPEASDVTKVGSLQGHDILQLTERHSVTIGANRGGCTTISVSGLLSKGVLSNLSLASTVDNKLKAADLYHYIITKLNITLAGDHQSEGAIKVWKALAKKRGVLIHGYSPKGRRRGVNLDVNDDPEEDIWSEFGPSGDADVGQLELVATKKVPGE